MAAAGQGRGALAPARRPHGPARGPRRRRRGGRGVSRHMSNAVCPGAIATDLRANSTRILGKDAPEMRGIGGDEAAVRAITPAGRRGTLQEVAAAACYLAGEEAAYVTGQTLVIDGRWTGLGSNHSTRSATARTTWRNTD